MEAAKQKIKKPASARRVRHRHQRAGAERREEHGRAPFQRLVAMPTHHGNTSQPSPSGTQLTSINAPQAGIVPASFRREHGGKSSRSSDQRPLGSGKRRIFSYGKEIVNGHLSCPAKRGRDRPNGPARSAARWQAPGGGRGVGGEGSLCAAALHHASRGSPPPLRFAGEDVAHSKISQPDVEVTDGDRNDHHRQSVGQILPAPRLGGTGGQGAQMGIRIACRSVGVA